MSNVKISQLPEFTGNTSGSWLIMNNSGQTTTYKVNINTIGTLSSSGTSGTSGAAGSSGTSGASPFAQTGSFYNTTNNIGITGSLNVLGSGSFSSAVKFFSSSSYGNSAVQPGAYVTESSPVSQSNLYFSNPLGTNGQIPLLTNLTGSIVISGSNNIIFNSNRNNTLVTNGTYGYINGYNNFAYVVPTLTTSSVVLPLINQNFLQGTVAMGFTSSSLAVPFVNSNNINNSVTLNHQSGSVGFSSNNILGTFTSTQQLTPGKAVSSVNSNIVVNSIILNHLSSSINYSNNIGGPLTVTNLVSSSVSAGNNGIAVNNNILQGSGHGIWASGSNASGNARAFNNNLIVGVGNAVTASQVASNSGNLTATSILGQNLIVSASHTTSAIGGTVFLGRYNGINNGLDDSQNIVFAVGTGTGTSTRRTGMWIDSGSNAVISGSLTVSGSVQGNVVSTSISSNTASLDMSLGTFFELTLPTGTTHITATNIKPGYTANVYINSVSNSYVSFPSNFKQPSGFSYSPTIGTGLDILSLTTKDSTNVYVVNSKNFS